MKKSKPTKSFMLLLCIFLTSRSIAMCEQIELQSTPLWTGLVEKMLTEQQSSKYDLPPGLGAEVMTVYPDSPAEKAGFEPQDIILLIDGEPLINPNQIFQKTQTQSVGSNIEFNILRDDAEQVLSLATAQKPAPQTLFKLTKQLVDAGHAPAKPALGVMYFDGYGVEQDKELGLEMIKETADAGDRDNQAVYAFFQVIGVHLDEDEQNIEEGLKNLRLLAEQGNAMACTKLGILHLYGPGVDIDDSMAWDFFQQAAELGSSESLGVFVGQCYGFLGEGAQTGKGTDRDYIQAARYFQEGAIRGDPFAMRLYAWLLKNGYGIEPDPNSSFEWTQTAAEAGDHFSMYLLGAAYENGDGVNKSQSKAFQWYRKGAELGESNCQLNMGFCYHNGKGVPQSYLKARDWYLKSADQGNSIAMNNLGYIYLNGNGVSKSYSKAYEFYQKGSQLGDPNCMTMLGYMHIKGYGVPKDREAAIKYYLQAAELGQETAIANLKDLGIDYKK